MTNKHKRLVTAMADDATEVAQGGNGQGILVRALSGGLVISDGGYSITVDEKLPSTFYVMFDRIVPATNKYMATLFNTSSTRKVNIQKIYRCNWQITAVTGVVLDQYLARITARTTGTSVAIKSVDTLDSVPSGIEADTNSSSVTEDHVIRRLGATNEELALSGQGIEMMNYGYSGPFYERQLFSKGLVLRQNEGITIRNITNSSVGSVSYIIEFTEEPV